MDPARSKSLNSEDSNSCRISMSDDDDDDDTVDRVGLFDYYQPPRKSNGTAASSDNYSFSESTSPCTKGSLWDDSISLNSYAKAQFEKQVAQKDAINHRRLIDIYKHLSDSGGNERGEALETESAKESEKTGAKDSSLFQAGDYNELVQKNNSKVFDEVLSCESGEHEHDVDEFCCDAETERRAEYNSIIHERNTEQFDEVLSIESDSDSVKNTGLPVNSCSAIEETVAHPLNSESKEVADSDFKVSELKVKSNGYDSTSQRKAYGSKYSGSSLRSVDRCSSLLSSCGYVASTSLPHYLTIDGEKKREQVRPLVCSDPESETDVSCGIGNCQVVRSDDSDDSTRFCEQTSELNIRHQPFYSQQDISEQGRGDWPFRGSSLHASSFRGYPTSQFHLTRYPYSFSPELEQQSLLTSRYYQLRLKRQYKRERQDAAVVNSTDVPGYKGNLDVEELLSYINDSKGLGCRSETSADTSGSRSAEKTCRRKKKGGSKGAAKSNRTECSSKSIDKLTCDAKVVSAVKTNERVRVKSAGRLNCIDTFSDEERDAYSASWKQEIGGDSIGQRIGDSRATFQDTCDISQGNVDSIKTVAVDRELDKSLMQSKSYQVLRSVSNDVPLLRASVTEDDFTMVTKKKKPKKHNSKRAKQPPSDCLSSCPVSSDSVGSTCTVHESSSPIGTASKESVVDCCQMKTRNSALSKFSNPLRPLADKTVAEDCGLYLEAHNEKIGDEVQKKLAKVYGKGVDVHAGARVQSLPTSAPVIGESKHDSAASKSNFRQLSSQGRPTLQSRDKQESRKSLIGAETLPLPLKVTARASTDSGVRQVTVEKQKHSKRQLTEQRKGRSVERLEMSLSGKQDNLLQDNAAKPQKPSQEEKVKPQQLVQEEQVNSENLSQNEKVFSEIVSPDKVIFENVSPDKKIISENVSPDKLMISENVSPDKKVISENVSPEKKVNSENVSPVKRVVSENVSPDKKVISENVSPDKKVISETLFQDVQVISEKLFVDKEVISENLYQDKKVISEKISQDVKFTSESLPQEWIAKPQGPSQNEEIISQNSLQYETNVFCEISLDQSQINTSLSENPFSYGVEMPPQLGQDDISIRRALAEHVIEMSEILLPVEQSISQDSLDNAFSGESSFKEAFDPHLEQPVVFLDRQRRLFSVPAKNDLGLKFGHFDDFEGASPDESRTPQYPGPPISIIHYIPVPYNDEDGQDGPIPDSNSTMYPISHQYMQQVMYANGPLPPMCKSAYPVYPNGHMFPVPMQFAPFVPPGFCIQGLSHTSNVPVGVVSPTMNNHAREETLSPESIPDFGDSCAGGFPIAQGLVVSMEPISQYHPQPEIAEASVSLLGARRSKSVFNVRTAVDYLYSEWLNVRRKEREPNSGVVRYNAELDL